MTRVPIIFSGYQPTFSNWKGIPEFLPAIGSPQPRDPILMLIYPAISRPNRFWPLDAGQVSANFRENRASELPISDLTGCSASKWTSFHD
eukprot:598898-Prorocentrum_minimum.AAC.1